MAFYPQRRAIFTMQSESKSARTFPSICEPLQNRFGDPPTGTFEQRSALVGVSEPSIHNDAVGVVSGGDLAPPGNGREHIDAQVPLHVDGNRLDGIRGAGPLGHGETGLLRHLAGQSVDRIFAVLDHTARRGPIRSSVASKVLDQQETPLMLHQPRRNAPATQTRSVSFGPGGRRRAHRSILARNRDTDERRPRIAPILST